MITRRSCESKYSYEDRRSDGVAADFSSFAFCHLTFVLCSKRNKVKCGANSWFLLRRYWEVQVDVAESVQGWIWWAWKVRTCVLQDPPLCSPPSFLSLLLVYSLLLFFFSSSFHLPLRRQTVRERPRSGGATQAHIALNLFMCASKCFFMTPQRPSAYLRRLDMSARWSYTRRMSLTAFMCASKCVFMAPRKPCTFSKFRRYIRGAEAYAL